MDWKGYCILEGIEIMKPEIKAQIIEHLKLLIPLGIILLFGLFLYYVMSHDTSTPELDKKVSYYNEKLNDAIPDWRILVKCIFTMIGIRYKKVNFQGNKERESIKTLFYFICVNLLDRLFRLKFSCFN